MNIYIVIISVVILTLTNSCHTNNNNLEEILSKAGKNREELTKTIDYFKTKNNLEGYKCSLFLIENMNGLFEQRTKEKVLDINNIKSNYLINNIENALKYKYKGVDSNIFYEYILPYRIANEPITYWRDDCINRYNKYRNNSYMKTIQQINDSLKKGFVFSTNEYPAHYKSWFDLINNRRGNCWAMVFSALYPLRALGIPVTVDYVINWANTNGGMHSWNVLLLKEDKFIPFMGCETSPNKYDTFLIYRQKRLPAKIFRMTYSINQTNITKIEKNELNIPKILNKQRQIDVTHLYFPVCNITLHTNKKAKIFYLSTLSNGKWQPVSWTEKKSNKIVFNNMTKFPIYITTVYENRKSTPVSYPFFISKKRVNYLKPNSHKSIDININTLQSKNLDEISTFSMQLSENTFYEHMDSINDNKYSTEPMAGKTYKLYYWDGRWLYHSEETKKHNKLLVFKNVPSNCIYRISENNALNEERPFTYSNDNQVWW